MPGRMSILFQPLYRNHDYTTKQRRDPEMIWRCNLKG